MKVDPCRLRLYAVTDRAWLNGGRLADAVAAALDGGATFVQLREKALDPADLLAGLPRLELIGDCQVTMLKATQRVSMRYLDVAGLTGDLGDLTQEKLKTIVQTRDRDQVYDDNDQYLPAVTQEAYTNALKQVLKTAKNSYTNIEFDLNLEYRGGKWQVLTAPELLVALTGGTGT